MVREVCGVRSVVGCSLETGAPGRTVDQSQIIWAHRCTTNHPRFSRFFRNLLVLSRDLRGGRLQRIGGAPLPRDLSC